MVYSCACCLIFNAVRSNEEDAEIDAIVAHVSVLCSEASGRIRAEELVYKGPHTPCHPHDGKNITKNILYVEYAWLIGWLQVNCFTWTPAYDHTLELIDLKTL